MDAERICEERNEQLSASDSVEVLEEETNGNMDASDECHHHNQEAPQFCSEAKKGKMSSGITVII